MSYYLFNTYGCKEYQKKISNGCSGEKIKCDRQAYKKNAANNMQNYLHIANGVKYITKKVPIFVPISINYIWAVRPS